MAQKIESNIHFQTDTTARVIAVEGKQYTVTGKQFHNFRQAIEKGVIPTSRNVYALFERVALTETSGEGATASVNFGEGHVPSAPNVRIFTTTAETNTPGRSHAEAIVATGADVVPVAARFARGRASEKYPVRDGLLTRIWGEISSHVFGNPNSRYVTGTDNIPLTQRDGAAIRTAKQIGTDRVRTFEEVQRNILKLDRTATFADEKPPAEQVAYETGRQINGGGNVFYSRDGFDKIQKTKVLDPGGIDPRLLAAGLTKGLTPAEVAYHTAGSGGYSTRGGSLVDHWGAPAASPSGVEYFLNGKPCTAEELAKSRGR